MAANVVEVAKPYNKRTSVPVNLIIKLKKINKQNCGIPENLLEASNIGQSS